MALTPPDLSTSVLTSGTVNGEGVFDVLMRTINAQLLEQFQSKRISNTDYGNVYVAALQTTLQQSTQYLLERDKAAQEAILIQAQVAKAEVDILLANKQLELIDAQVRKAEADILATNAQIALTEQQTANLLLDAGKINKEIELMSKQIDKLSQDILLSTELVNKAKQEVIILTAEADRQPALTTKLNNENTILTKQASKLDAEILTESSNKALLDTKRSTELEVQAKLVAERQLINQRETTEKAQTVTPTGGIMKAQYDVLVAQKEGFANDYTIKAVKAANDVYAIAKSNDPEAVADPTNMLSVLTTQLSKLPT